ncbi:hypothetical protein ACR42D_10590 [Desulfovibrio caledoniensis]
MRDLFDLMGAADKPGEIVVDLFAGGGGASEGIRMALGRDPEAADNYTDEAERDAWLSGTLAEAREHRERLGRL